MTNQRQNIQEDLVNLFLRLNGYLTTGLIIHSSTFGKNQTEIDTVAIRFPYHNQDDRVVDCSEYLQIPIGTIDIIISEVKSGKEPIQFNQSLRGDKNSIEKLVKWVGAFETNEIDSVVDALDGFFKPKTINTPENFNSYIIQTKNGKYSIRPIIFSLDRPLPKKNQTRFVSGQTILDFIWSCLRPDNERASCSTTYNYNMWGHSLLPIVQYFKNPKLNSAGNINDFYKYFNC